MGIFFLAGIFLYILAMVLIGIFGCRRIDKVHDFRMKILNEEGVANYDRLPSFDSMCNKWWIPVDRFTRKERMLEKLEGK